MRALFGPCTAPRSLIHGTSLRLRQSPPLARRGPGAGLDPGLRVRNAGAIRGESVRFAPGYGAIDESGCVADRFASPRTILGRPRRWRAPDERRTDSAGRRYFKEVQGESCRRL